LLYSSDVCGAPCGYDIYVALGQYDNWMICHPECDIAGLNTPSNQLAPSMTEDFQKIYYGSDEPGGFGSMDLWMIESSGGAWLPPVNLGAPVNSSGAEEMPFITPDGAALYFGSNRPGGQGGQDIWMSQYGGGGWGSPENLGDVVNSPYDERGPSLTRDGNVLFFGSNRPGGFGGVDVYYSIKVGGNWTTPLNAGPIVNTPDDETCPTPGPDPISAYGPDLYFTSANRPGGYGLKDLYIAIPGPPPTGACCNPDTGECTITTLANCAYTWLGADVPCNVQTCPPPIPRGACCDPQGNCTITTQAECLPPNVWHPEWTSCEPNYCPPPVPTQNTTWGQIKANYR
jgi:hypothetical protein